MAENSNSKASFELVLEKIGNLDRQLEEKFEGVTETIEIIREQVSATNGSVGRHDQWIHENKIVIGNMALQQKMLAEVVQSHQKYIDQRDHTFEELIDVRKTVAGMSDYALIRRRSDDHELYISEARGATKKISKILGEWAQTIMAVVAIVALLITLLKK